MLRQEWIGGSLLLAVAVLVAVGQWRLSARDEERSLMLVSHPQGVMGTDCTLAVVVGRSEAAQAAHALREAEAVLRRIEALMSNWLADSEVSRLCRAEAGEEVRLSPETLEVLVAAREAFEATEGAFDVTCLPQLELWRRAGKVGELPGESPRAKAREASHWGLLELGSGGAVKEAASAGVDLGGIAKGYAIDQALGALRRAGARGGMVDVGGDLACFGAQADGRPWQVDVEHPARSGAAARMRVADGAVATSGDAARYWEIGGLRYSQILDPRSCRPADAVRAATVSAPTAMAADIWATALGVLGTAGLAKLPGGVEALLILADGDGFRLVATRGFSCVTSAELQNLSRAAAAGASGVPTGR